MRYLRRHLHSCSRLALGIRPDTPNARGAVSRVVKGVSIYPLEAKGENLPGSRRRRHQDRIRPGGRTGQVLARHHEGSAYYLEIGLDALQAMLARGIAATLGQVALSASQLTFAFFGLPAYGEDSRLLDRLNTVASPTLEHGKYKCGNDMVCAWAGALGGQDGINIVAGTGSIAYGEFVGRQARAGGWGELFSEKVRHTGLRARH